MNKNAKDHKRKSDWGSRKTEKTELKAGTGQTGIFRLDDECTTWIRQVEKAVGRCRAVGIWPWWTANGSG